ncbi:ComEC/Rec2 family competence protein [Haloferax denitrificans]|uniref:ComEC/Rec2 family competence protein n=1 Tax=Haloferax denitrificans TaxID=35745 RepID=UPI0009FCB055|nr:hydrolase [Haloferax denitrificans]
MIPNTRLDIHFLNVDHGDCTIIRHPGDQHRSKGRISFVDINDWKDKKEKDVAGLSALLTNAFGSLTKSPISEEEYAQEYLNDPIEYFQNEVDERDQDVWRFISTHPDMDHLSGFERLCDEVGISGIWDTKHDKSLDLDGYWPPQYDSSDWAKYQEICSGDTDHFHMQPTRGDKRQYWEDDNIDILHPTPEFVEQVNQENEGQEQNEFNNISLVLKINTRAGGILLPGDAEEEAWEEILKYHNEDVLEDVAVLKASHHGRKDGFHAPAVEAMDPEYVILSVGNKPSTDAHQDYRRVCSDDCDVISTRQYGRIRVTCGERGSLNVFKEYPDGIFDLPGDA